MRKISLALQLAALVCGLFSLSLSVHAQDQDWHTIAGMLMSPACPGRTLINCTSAHAEQWRELIRQKLAQGESQEQIVQYFVDIAGEAVLAAPPKKGFALTAWLLPFFVVLNGAGLIVLLALRWARSGSAQEPTTSVGAAETSQEDHPVDPYISRVREELKKFSG